MSGNTPWINEGSLRARYRVEQNHLVKELNQPDRDLIMDQIQDERRDGRRQSFLGGYKVASIPLVDWERVKLKYPDLQAPDKEIRTKALVQFSNDPDMACYLVRKA